MAICSIFVLMYKQNRKNWQAIQQEFVELKAAKFFLQAKYDMGTNPRVCPVWMSF